MAPSDDPVTMTIRPECAADRDGIAALVEAAFGSDAEARLVDGIRASPEYIPELALVAESAGEIVGHVMVSLTRLLGEDGTQHQIFHLSPLAVRPDHQRRGVGSALVRAVTTEAEQRGATFVVLEGSPDYYARFGFEPAADYGITMPLPDWAPPEAAQIVRLRGFDGSARGRVVYPPAFDDVTGE